MRRLRLTLAFVVLCFFCISVQSAIAGTITFESVPATFYSPAGASFVDSGYRFTNLAGGMYVLMPEGCTPRCSYNETQRLLAYESFQPMFEMTAVDGGRFSLFAFDVGESFSGMPARWAKQLVVEGERATGQVVTQVFDLDGINDGTGPLTDFERFALHPTFSNISSVRFYGLGGVEENEFTIDNVTVRAIPDPGSTLLLLGIGLAGLRAGRKRLQ